MYKVLEHTSFAFELFAMNASPARRVTQTLTRLHDKMSPRLTGLPYLANWANRLGGSPHLSCKRDQNKMKLYGRAGYLTYPGVPHLHVNRSLEPCHLKTSLRPLLMMKSSQLKCQVSTRYLKPFAIKMDGGMSTIQISLLNMT